MHVYTYAYMYIFIYIICMCNVVCAHITDILYLKLMLHEQ